jgi:DNA-binding PadR family transcriptional regulator
MVYRKPGTLLPLERDILSVIASHGQQGAHGYAVAKDLATDGRSKALVSHGTLYKALDRLRSRGLLSAEWEDSAAAESAERPRRKVYWVTAAGAKVLAEAASVQPGFSIRESPA